MFLPSIKCTGRSFRLNRSVEWCIDPLILAETHEYSSAGTGNLDGFQYNGTMTGTATPTSINGTETMVFTTGCPGRVVAYTFRGTK
jgi:hypothetical protein